MNPLPSAIGSIEVTKSIGPCSKPPFHVLVGDVVLLDGRSFEVLSVPFVGLSGHALLEAPSLFWRARVRAAEDPEARAGFLTGGWTRPSSSAATEETDERPLTDEGQDTPYGPPLRRR
jgi:hypothetical protein